MDWKTLLFSFGGRINRGKYWLGVLLLILVYIAAGIVFGVFYVAAGQTGAILGGIVALVAFVIVIWASIAIGIKRLHDREKSGWWLIIFWLVPGILSGVGSALGDVVGIVASLISLGISIWGFVEIGCLKGTTGPNLFGPDPLPAEAD